MGARDSLAVDSYDLTFGDLTDRLDPFDETTLELIGVQGGEHSAKGVVRWDSVGDFHKAPKPLLLRVAELFHVHPGVCAAYHGEDSDCDYVHEVVSLRLVDSRVLEIREESDQRDCLCVFYEVGEQRQSF